MNTVIEQMLRKYDSKNIYDQKNAMKEVMQEIVLYGLSRAGFFREAAFYGGTALRIFYGLDRFSEDLDFSLMTSNPNFDLKAYFPEREKQRIRHSFCILKGKHQRAFLAFLRR